MVKDEALDRVMKFLDDHKPRNKQKFDESIKSSDAHIMNTVLSLLEAKEKTGIETAK